MRLDPAAEKFAEGLKKVAAPPDAPDTVDLQEPIPGPVQVDTPDVEGTIVGEAEPKDRVTRQNLFRNSATHPLVLYTFLLDKYGPIWITWRPDSLWIVIERDFKTNLASITKEKINAIKTLMMVDSFWRDWEVFEKVTQALNNNTVRFDIIQPPTLGQMWNAVTIARGARPDVTEFEPEVAGYVAAAAQEEGVEYLPPPLDFAQIILGDPPKDVVKRFKELSKSGTAVEFQETAADIQALKLHIAQEYTAFRNNQARAQGEVVA